MNNQTQLWTPSEEFIQKSNLKAFENWLAVEKGLHFDSYQDLWNWSVEQIADFWECIVKYFDVQFHTPYKQVISGNQMPNVQWFDGATLNYAEHIFRKKTSNDGTALVFQNEKGRRLVTWGELETTVHKIQQFLVSQGIREGDCVAGYMPNIPEAIATFLACNSIGAVWSCCSPDFGNATVVERFAQIEPKIFFAADGYQYGGKVFSRLSEIEAIGNAIPCIQQTVLISYQDEKATLPSAVNWNDLMSNPLPNEPLQFTPVSFDHPIWVLYSSGTTGKPKAITHSHGGVLIELLKYITFHNDVKAGEYFFWFTTTGWMMWNYVQGSMLAGGIPVLFDGSPTYPDIKVLWKMAADLRLPHFGTGAPFLTACMKKELGLQKEFDFSELRSVSSTGAPLPPEAFEWVYNSIGKHIWLCSMSGGTDVCSAFVGGNPYLPVFKGQIQSRALGCALYAYSDDGKRLTKAGQLGEMVIEQPMPSMPIYFWNDKNKERYKNSYFNHFKGKWRHGDWVAIYEKGSLVIQGRSDAVLNRNGIRIGTAEIYNVLEQIPAIKDSLVINLEQPNGDDVMPLFVQLKEGHVLDDDLENIIRQSLRRQCSPRHVPNKILEVPDIPYTLNGKKMEVPVKKVLLKMDAASSINKDTIRNPEAMDYFFNLKL